ncbi:Uncharacterized protein Fot_41350 [Forsythia ovata]|uniref:Uncharacterized protein n=1 Tax=Forsythia ovata TaxID=205694 RepID=A0ABD1RI03_9LAMI
MKALMIRLFLIEKCQDLDMLVVEVEAFLGISLREFQLDLVIVHSTEWSLEGMGSLKYPHQCIKMVETIMGKFASKKESDAVGFSVDSLSAHLHLLRRIGLRPRLKIM